MTDLLCVFAHPDDDVTIGPLLAHYAQRGASVRIVYLTSGQAGANLIGPEQGDALGTLREKEARAACNAYGIGEPLLFRTQDTTLAGLPTQELLSLGQRLAEVIREAEPRAIITFGPDGYTRHSDHKATCSLVTDLLQSWPTDDLASPALYYVALPEHAARALVAGGFPPQGLAWAHARHLDAEIGAADGIKAAIAALHCYPSQFGPAEMAMLEALLRDILQGRVHLRTGLPTAAPAQRRWDLFEAL